MDFEAVSEWLRIRLWYCTEHYLYPAMVEDGGRVPFLFPDYVYFEYNLVYPALAAHDIGHPLYWQFSFPDDASIVFEGDRDAFEADYLLLTLSSVGENDRLPWQTPEGVDRA